MVAEADGTGGLNIVASKLGGLEGGVLDISPRSVQPEPRSSSSSGLITFFSDSFDSREGGGVYHRAGGA